MKTDDTPRTFTDCLEQGKYWRPKDSDEFVLLEDMTTSHLVNLRAWLLRRAPRIKYNYEMYMISLISGPLGPRGEMACDAVDSMMDELALTSAEQWMSELPLLQAISGIIRTREAAAAQQVAADAGFPPGAFGMEIVGGDDVTANADSSACRPDHDPDLDPDDDGHPHQHVTYD